MPRITATYRAKRLASRKLKQKRRKDLDGKVRLQALIAYSGDPPKCACCGETELKFLSFDHINGGGNKHKKELHARNIAYWLKMHNWPPGFQILCYNCNMTKGFYGKCPHQN